MARYTVHAPLGADGLEHAVFLRDGFRVPAFLFSAFWLIWQGAWRSALLVGTVFIAFFALAFVLKLPPAAEFGGVFLLMLLLGFEGSNLIRWELGRKGLNEIGLVVGDDSDEMERRFFADMLGDGILGDKPANSPELPAQRASFGTPSAILGLFPGPATGKSHS